MAKVPTLFNFFVFTYPQSDDFLTNADTFLLTYADNFCFLFQLQHEAFSAHSSNIEEWADERGLVISAPKLTITLFTPQFAQSNTHPQITLNSSILPLERTPCIIRVTFDPHFQFNVHVKSLVTQHHKGPYW